MLGVPLADGALRDEPLSPSSSPGPRTFETELLPLPPGPPGHGLLDPPQGGGGGGVEPPEPELPEPSDPMLKVGSLACPIFLGFDFARPNLG